MKKIIYPFLAFFLVLYLLVSYNQVIKNDDGQVLSYSTVAKEEKTLSPEKQIAQYQKTAQGVVNVLEAISAPIENQAELEKRIDAVQELEETVVDSKVPGEYRDLHLKLLYLTNELKSKFQEEAKVSDFDYQLDFSGATEEINNLKQEYPWLNL